MAVNSVLKKRVEQLIQDDFGALTRTLDGEIESCISRAVEGEYSLDRPHRRMTTLTGDGDRDVDLSDRLINAIGFWGPGATCIEMIEYPIDQSDPEYLEPGRDWALRPEFVDRPTQIHFLEDTPGSGDTINVFYRTIHRAALPDPTGVTVTNVGTAGATTYAYAVCAVDALGTTLATAATTTTGNATLSATNYNTVDWEPVDDATSYRVYRTSGGATQGLIGTTTDPTVTLDDTGLAGGGESVPSLNTTNHTIYQRDLEPVCALCASYCLEMIATYHADSRGSAFTGDAVAWGELAAKFAESAKWLRARYERAIKPKDQPVKPAVAERNFIPPPSHRGRNLYDMYNYQRSQR